MTSVEWLVNEVRNSIQGMSVIVKEDIFKQAKEMERQQIIDAHGIKTISINQDQAELITGDQYYNETYK